MDADKQGLLVVVSAPSGGGKDAVVRGLVNNFPNSYKFITTTTRPPRPGNKQGVDYNFVSREEFSQKIADGGLLEYTEYNGHFYGTPKDDLEKALGKNNLVFLIVETEGKKNIDKAGIPNFSIFLLPESEEVLRQRIEKRGGLNEAQIEDRLNNARREIKESEKYDCRIVNRQGKLEEAIAEAAKAIKDRLSRA